MLDPSCATRSCLSNNSVAEDRRRLTAASRYLKRIWLTSGIWVTPGITLPLPGCRWRQCLEQQHWVCFLGSLLVLDLPTLPGSKLTSRIISIWKKTFPFSHRKILLDSDDYQCCVMDPLNVYQEFTDRLLLRDICFWYDMELPIHFITSL